MALGIFYLMPLHELYELHELELQGSPLPHLFVHPALQGDCHSPRGAQCVAAHQQHDDS